MRPRVARRGFGLSRRVLRVIDCERTEERFADTFAKWALNGAVSEVGAGYGIAMPASLEGWGAPLAELSFRLPAG